MERCRVYPNYWNYYYYEEGEKLITLVRKVAGKVIYKTSIPFNSEEEAKEYFKNECGA